ncbi:MAG: branched-chain amino acid ABC transporter permease [Candidatus Sumerlaeia bacterium]
MLDYLATTAFQLPPPEVIMQLILSGIAFGSIYAMVAVGFNIIYNATGIINLAQGEFVMLGGMLMVFAHDKLGLPVWAALLFSVFLVMAIGVIFERLAIRPVKKPSVLLLIIITIAGSFIFRGAALLIWGDQYYSFEQFLGDEPVRLLGASVTRQHLIVLATLLLVAVGLFFFFGFTMIGKAMRATSFNRTAARLVGINARNMVMLAFGLSAAIGALAGTVVAPITGAKYDDGVMFGLKGFSAAVLGGLGNNPAAVAAGLILGVLEAFAGYSPLSNYKEAVVLFLLIVVLFIRPSGIFGKTELSKLSEF